MMSLPRPTDQKRQHLVREALIPLRDAPKVDRLFEICDCLFDIALNQDQLLHEDADNPVEHHTTVLAHMIQIVKTELDKERLTWKQTEQAAALAILHDICPARKITEDMINSAPPEKREELREQRESSAPIHMRNGADMACKKLLALNQKFNESVFTDEEISFICGIISIHDNPKLKIKIPKDNTMAVMLREADRLWMVTSKGVRADLERKKRENPHLNPDDLKAQLEHVKKNIKRFEDERGLYCEDDGPFYDDRFFIRTSSAGKIFIRWCNYWRNLGLALTENNCKKEVIEMSNPTELMKQCRFCRNFETDYDIELLFYACLKGHFPRADDRVGYPLALASDCRNFVLDDHPGSRWSELPQDYKDSLV